MYGVDYIVNEFEQVKGPQHEQGLETPRPITGNLYGVGTEGARRGYEVMGGGALILL